MGEDFLAGFRSASNVRASSKGEHLAYVSTAWFGDKNTLSLRSMDLSDSQYITEKYFRLSAGPETNSALIEYHPSANGRNGFVQISDYFNHGNWQTYKFSMDTIEVNGLSNIRRINWEIHSSERQIVDRTTRTFRSSVQTQLNSEARVRGTTRQVPVLISEGEYGYGGASMFITNEEVAARFGSLALKLIACLKAQTIDLSMM